jgi:thiol-disulfide isomerase/thioredoxin
MHLLPFDGRISSEGAVYYVNVAWCGYCRRARPIMEQLAGHLGTACRVYDVDGDRWKDYLARVLGPSAPRSYPTILYIDGKSVTEFKDERTLRNLIEFSCQMCGGCAGL